MDGLLDSHVHSYCSEDGCETMEDLCTQALHRGLMGIAITDHCDLLDWDKEGYPQRVRQSYQEAEAFSQRYAGRLVVLKGVELGDALLREDLAKALLSGQAYDVVLASVHWSQTGENVYYSDFTQWSAEALDEYLTWYFGCMVKLAGSPYCDSLAHMTYPLRYIIGHCGLEVDLAPYASLIDETLRTLAGEGKALELNTAGLRQQIRDTAPPAWILERFRQLGGVYVTLGSDAHRLKNLGDGLKQGAAMLRAAGFCQYAYFQSRVPVLVDLPDEVCAG